MFALLTLAVVFQASELIATYPPASDRLAQAVGGLADHPLVNLRGYEVSGDSIDALDRAMVAQAPADREGKTHDAWTHSDVNYEFNVGACRPDLIETTVKNVVILPDLATRDRLSPGERTKWDRYFAALVAHEAHHVAIAEQGAVWVRDAMRAAPDCDEAVVAGGAANARLQAAQDEFDARTNHGANEGVLL